MRTDTPILTSKIAYGYSGKKLFAPLLFLRSKGAHAEFVVDHVRLLFDQHVTRPRTVQQLLAAGRVRVVEGKYVRGEP